MKKKIVFYEEKIYLFSTKNKNKNWVGKIRLLFKHDAYPMDKAQMSIKIDKNSVRYSLKHKLSNDIFKKIRIWFLFELRWLV